MRTILAILTLVLSVGLVGCGTSVAPTPIIVYVTPVPASSPAAVASGGAAQPTEAPAATASPSPTPTSTPTPSFATVSLPKIAARVAGATKTKIYEVTGSKPDELVAAVYANCRAQSAACVELPYTIHTTSTTNLGTGACKVTKAFVEIRPIAHLPHWSGPAQVYPELVAWWTPLLQHIASDETQLIKIQNAADKKLHTQLINQKCSAINGTILKWKRSLAASFDKFYAGDAKWTPPTYTGP